MLRSRPRTLTPEHRHHDTAQGLTTRLAHFVQPNDAMPFRLYGAILHPLHELRNVWSHNAYFIHMDLPMQFTPNTCSCRNHNAETAAIAAKTSTIPLPTFTLAAPEFRFTFTLLVAVACTCLTLTLFVGVGCTSRTLMLLLAVGCSNPLLLLTTPTWP